MNYLQPNWPAPANVKAYTTVRHGWGERNSYEQNTTFHTAYANETEQLKILLSLPEEPIWIKQIHGTSVVKAIPENKGTLADASYTSEINRVCIVLTADCLPILICHREGACVAAIHAGWRGLANGIIEATLEALPEPTHELMAWLGPAIGPQKFEVGKDVFDAFTAINPTAETAFVPRQEGKWLANLYDLAKIRLKKQGIEQIYGGDFCTYTQKDLFFSYRRDQGKTGRMASLIWIEKE